MTNSCLDTDEYKDYQQRIKKRLNQNEFDSFSELETLEVLLLYASSWRPKDIRPIAKELLERFLTLRDVLATSPQQLLETKGLGENEVCLLKVVESACFQKLTPLNPKQKILWKEILNLCRFKLSHEKTEQLLAIYLDQDFKILDSQIIQTGSPSKLPIYPRQIIQNALNKKANHLILAHNHPSGQARASQSDLSYTKELKNLLTLVNITLLDHLIIANNQIYSFKLKKLIHDDDYLE